MFRTDTWQAEHGDAVFDFHTTDKDIFKDTFKLRWGAGYDRVKYVNENNGMSVAKTLEEVPAYALDDFNSGNKDRINAVVKSWTKYTKYQRKLAIDTLIRFIGIFECDDKKVHEIIEGMEREK